MRLNLLIVLLALLISGCAALGPGGLTQPGQTSLTSLKAEGIVEINRGALLTGKAVILAESPGLFRIEVFGPFSQVMALLVSDGEAFSIYSEGKVKRLNWNEQAGASPFKASDIVSVLLGQRPSPDSADYVVTGDEKSGSLHIVKYNGGVAALTVTMSDYKKVSGALIPFDISIESGREKLKIRYSSVDLNPTIDPSVFSAAMP